VVTREKDKKKVPPGFASSKVRKTYELLFSLSLPISVLLCFYSTVKSTVTVAGN